MLVNVCNKLFGCSISSASVHADGYQPNNLCSNEGRARQNGFRVEHFVTPPVMLEVHLPQRVSVSNVLVKMDLKPSETACLELLLPSAAGTVSCSSASRDPAQWRPCCSCITQGQVGANFRSKPLCAAMKKIEMPLKCTQSRFSDNSSIEHAFKVAEVGSPILACTDAVAVRVKYMKTHRPVHINLIEVWAFFEKSPPPWLVALTAKVTAEGNSEEPSSSARNKASAAAPSEIESRSNSVCKALEMVKKPTVSEKFLDALTQEVMVLPMLLPSGQHVDRSTIDRHNAEELKWGRPPSDPFTGVPYTNTQEPVFDYKLKIELDHCLVQLPQGRQTVGSAASIQARLPSKRTERGSMPPSKRKERLE